MFSLALEQYKQYPLLLAAVSIIAFAFGASVGSFLNVVIYRLPLGISVNNPRRSFCPKCEYKIPWFLNLPLVSWLTLRGRCANCGTTISPRYFFVELFTGVLFLLAVYKFEFPLAIVICLVLSLFVVTVYIDIDHFIIPNEITLGGLCVALVASVLVPQMFLNYVEIVQNGPIGSRLWSLGHAALGAAAGYGILWTVVHLGKLAFGRVTQEFENPVSFQIHEVKYSTGEREPILFYEDTETENGQVDSTDHDDPDEPLKITEGDVPGWEKQPWSDVFSRPSDKLIMTCGEVRIDDREFTDSELTFFENRVKIRSSQSAETETIDLEPVEQIAGACSKVVIPREAMGWGDVKFLAMAGAFLGWQSSFLPAFAILRWTIPVVFTLVAASILGSLVALIMSILGKRDKAAKIPFGPYLVFGATLWLFYGNELVGWYWRLTTGSP